ncbi:hypothetical protein cand_019760 [Cryptosporidium andersoni]|uniref:Uncharacterized protein n=1 Tax=Cryptosporidium andersoni TaxID=117008 RepID=A0A1J4MSP8_9CRYT|nr:hypothetical protein cand_019760 [Cryptosporidium andersoni]
MLYSKNKANSNTACSTVQTNENTSLVPSGCSTPGCHCNGSAIVSSQSSNPITTQRCYVTSTGCHEAVVTTTTQEVRSHKCPPKVQQIHEHVTQPVTHTCISTLDCLNYNTSAICCTNIECICNQSCLSCPSGCNCKHYGHHHHGHHHHGHYIDQCNNNQNCCLNCNCCCASTVQTTVYPVYMSYPNYNQGRSIEVPYTGYPIQGSGYPQITSTPYIYY